MHELNPVLRLLVLVQIFLLFAVLLLPLLIQSLHEPVGKVVYGLFALFCILQALLLRRAFNKLQ